MPQRATGILRTELTTRSRELRIALCAEDPAALDALAALAIEALARGEPALAAASAGFVVLAEHLQSTRYRHASRMLGVLAAVGPDSVSPEAEGLSAWAGALVAHDYGVLPSWPHADVAMLMDRARQAPADVALALGCALGEVCERNGQDAEFAALQAQMAGIEMQSGASPFWRGYWSITSAWHLISFGKSDEALQRLQAAQALAAEHRLQTLGANAALQRARLIESHRDPRSAIALADQAIACGDPARTPLWWADHADIRCRIALHAADFNAAVGHARRAAGYLQAAAVWPGYQATYRVNEAYALLGVGALDEALGCLNALNETPMPRFLGARLRCLAELAALVAADQRGQWDAACQAGLADVLRRLRELEWPTVLPLLPAYVARLFARALSSGLEVDWVRAAIRTRDLSAPPGASSAWPWTVMVRALGTFDVVTESGSLRQPSREARKAASKPLDLLRFLAAHGHDAVPVDVVAEALWPGDGREGRQKAFDITAARLRRLLGSNAAVSVSDRRVRLNEQCVWIDVQAVNDRLEDSEGAAEGSASAGSALDAALALYRGPCLADSREPWAGAARERVRTRLAAALLRAARGPGVSASQRREWTLRATSADPAVARLMEVAAPS